MLIGYKNQINALIAIKQNTTNSKSIGLEKAIKLILVSSKFIFPAFHISVIFSEYNRIAKSISMEFYVLFKFALSFSILYFQLFHFWLLPNGKSFFLYWTIYMMIETLFYPATYIFCVDFFPKPISFVRSIIFVFIDYIMVVVDFATLYLITNSLCTSQDKLISNSLDALYFSFVTAVTIGYGDISAQLPIGKMLVICQSIIFLIYGVLFLNYYTSKIGERKSIVIKRKKKE